MARSPHGGHRTPPMPWWGTRSLNVRMASHCGRIDPCFVQTENGPPGCRPRHAGLCKEKATVAGGSQIGGGGPSLERTRLRLNFPVSGKFAGKLRQLRLHSCTLISLKGPRGAPCRPMPGFRAARRTGNFQGSNRERGWRNSDSASSKPGGPRRGYRPLMARPWQPARTLRWQRTYSSPQWG
jgi:hypothetical protein